jgi:sugar O-acyltransferase (sialic acid O-acetyltransferase NeuD family)
VSVAARPLVIVGCSGHGREVMTIVRAVNLASPDGPLWDLLGFVDDSPSPVSLERLARTGVPLLGPSDLMRDLAGEVSYVIGVGSPRIRHLLAGKLDGFGLPAARLVHPDATVGPDTVLSDGVVLFAGARVTTNVVLGRHVHLNQNTTVGHDSVLEDFVSVNPLAAVSGDCRLKSGVLIGTNACVLQGLTVHADATVGAGACVVRDVPAQSVVVGVPARAHGHRRSGWGGDPMVGTAVGSRIAADVFPDAGRHL